MSIVLRYFKRTARPVAALAVALVFQTSCGDDGPGTRPDVNDSPDGGTGDASAGPSANPTLTTRTTATAPARSSTQTTPSSAIPPGVDAGGDGGGTDTGPAPSESGEPPDGGTDGGPSPSISTTVVPSATATGSVPDSGPSLECGMEQQSCCGGDVCSAGLLCASGTCVDEALSGGGERARTGPLVLQVTTAVQTAIPNGRNLYFITVGNTSGEAVDNVSVQLRVPEGLQFQYQNDAWPDSSACSGNATCSPNTEANWAIGTILPRTSVTIQVNPLVLTTVATGDSIVTRVVLNAPGLSSVSVDKPVPVVSDPMEAELALTAEADPVVPGQTTVLNVDVGQVGALPFSNTALRLELPPGMTPVATSDGGTVAGGIVTWPVGAMDIGATLHREVKVQVSSGATPGNVYNPRVTLDYTTGQAWSEVAQLPITVVEAQAPLTLTVSRAMTPGKPSGRVRYVATVTNTALRDVPASYVWFRQPPELTHQYQNAVNPNMNACAGNAICADGDEAYWTLGTIPAGASQTFEVEPSLLSTVTSGALVTAHFQLAAPEMSPLQVSLTTPVTDSAAAQLSLGADAAPTTAGSSFTYQLEVGQVGAADLTASELTLILPAGLTATAISDNGIDLDDGTIVWDVGTVPVAGSASRSVTVAVATGVLPGAVFKARANLSFDGGAAIDATAEANVSVVAAVPPLSATLEVIPEGAVGVPAWPVAVLGDRLLYRTTVTNTSARSIDGVTMQFRVPEGIQFQYQNDANPNSSACAGNASCTVGTESSFDLGTLAAGQSLIVEVNANVLTTLLAGSLIAMDQLLTATGVSDQIFVHKTVPTIQ